MNLFTGKVFSVAIYVPTKNQYAPQHFHCKSCLQLLVTKSILFYSIQYQNNIYIFLNLQIIASKLVTVSTKT